MLSNLSENRFERWRMVRTISNLYRRPNDKTSEDFFNSISFLKDLNAPKALEEWYELAAEVTDLWSGQDFLLSPKQALVKNNFLIFFSENQNCWEAGVSLEDFNDDPKVYQVCGKEIVPLSPSVSLFCLQMLLCETFWSGQFSYFDCITGIEGKTLQSVREMFKPANLPELCLWSDNRIRFFEAEKVLLRLDYDLLYKDFSYWAIAAEDKISFLKTIEQFQSAGVEIDESII